VAAVFPNGSVWNYIFEADRGVCVPQRSDMMVDDLRPTSSLAAVTTWVTCAGQILALLWAVDAVSDLLGAALLLTM
jgi:hypothetical protein